MPSYRKGTWAEEEDAMLLSTISACESCDWNQISDILGTRTPKQCAERYHQNLRPGLNHGPLTAYECYLVDKLVEERGTCWAYIAKQLVNRSENKIKNWYYNRRFKRYRDQRQRELLVRAPSPYLKFESLQQPVPMLQYQEDTAANLPPADQNNTSHYVSPYAQHDPPQPYTTPFKVVPTSTDMPKSSNLTLNMNKTTTPMNVQDSGHARASLALHWQMHAFSAVRQAEFEDRALAYQTAQATFSGWHTATWSARAHVNVPCIVKDSSGTPGTDKKQWFIYQDITLFSSIQ
ncbi:hypothetical protein E4T43_04774 [Aureobasidium subglaciale]|nr:hypothetical protein E4T43_04774 [Aureobasidium subglaciale]